MYFYCLLNCKFNRFWMKNEWKSYRENRSSKPHIEFSIFFHWIVYNVKIFSKFSSYFFRRYIALMHSKTWHLAIKIDTQFSGLFSFIDEYIKLVSKYQKKKFLENVVYFIAYTSTNLKNKVYVLEVITLVYTMEWCDIFSSFYFSL